MYRNRLILAALSSALILGAAAGTSFAAPGDRPDGPRRHAMMGGPRGAAFREITFVRMLKQFDTNKDGQISKQEETDGTDKIFNAIDTNNDGSLTPGEIRTYRQAQVKAMRDQRRQSARGNGDNAAPAAPKTADNGDQARPERPDRDGRRWMRHGGRFMQASMMMRRIDSDENGQISKQEATAAADKLFTRMDSNKDGVISIDDMPDRPFP
ncbi:calcium-binding protein [Rhizobium binxianense]